LFSHHLSNKIYEKERVWFGAVDMLDSRGKSRNENGLGAGWEIIDIMLAARLGGPSLRTGKVANARELAQSPFLVE